MAFKTDTFEQVAAENPAAHFKTLTKRQFPDVMPHQKEMLESYAFSFVNKTDVALQLPTGSGKTLVGMLIADWRRLKFRERVLYLCPTVQLVRQTILQARNQYGIDAVDLSGSKSNFTPSDTTAYKTGAQVAVSTYSGLFNTHPYFLDPDIIIIDDAHAAENYVAKMWSLSIEAGTPLHDSLAAFLKPHIDAEQYSRLTGDWVGAADSNWVEKLPSPQVSEISTELISIIDAFADQNAPNIFFPWSLLRDHLDACHIYLGSREILIRPLIPPTSTHQPFANATQRIFMSATLGAGGDLERLTGRRSIDRLRAPDGFQNAGVGRRFFVFPSLSLTGDATDALRVRMEERAGRSVVLTPSSAQADTHRAAVASELPTFQTFDADDIESDKAPFVSSPRAVAILANRYDGIDFPGDECRLLSVDGLPRAMNAQERFIMTKMTATALFNERIQTRVLQAVGRCTRALQDRSCVVVTGTELVDLLADRRKWKYFHPELQAELKFGVNQSTDVNAQNIFENFEMFLNNDAGWSTVDGQIRGSIGKFLQEEFPGMSDLNSVVAQEVSYQEAIWNKDYSAALIAAKAILAGLHDPALRGYRALWHYLAGSAALRLSSSPDDAQAKAAREQFMRAKGAAPSISWLNTLARTVGPIDEEKEQTSNEVLLQVEKLEQKFLDLGTATNKKFEVLAAEISRKLSNAAEFEHGQVQLGELLGFTAGNEEGDAAPDPWWLGSQLGIVFEDHADGDALTVFGAVKARQASGHPKWLKKKVSAAKEMTIEPVLVTPCTKAKSGADPQLDNVRYWSLAEFRSWATTAIAVLRELKGTFPGEADLVWRVEASERLQSNKLTLESILASLLYAPEAMEIVP
ncbi:DEAD/DEAH box helicase family protein [Qipengyuania sp. 483]